MPLDFPNSPTVGATYTGPSGVIWTWDGAKWASGSGATAPTFNDVGRNLIHNPLFAVAQRGGGPFTTHGVFTLDRWNIAIGGGTYSVSQIALTDADRAGIGDEAAKYAYQGVVAGTAGATDVTFFEHHIEDVRRTANKTITLSFWAKATAGTPKLGVMCLQVFGSGGSPSSAVSLSPGTAVTLSTTWTRYTMSFALPSVAGKTFGTTAGTDMLDLRFYQSASTSENTNSGSIGVQSYTLQLWGVQLEVGSVATPLEQPDPQQDLAKCQRFFQTGSYNIGGYAASTGIGYAYFQPFPVPMRAVPSVIDYNSQAINVTSQGLPGSVTGILVIANGAAVGGFIYSGNFSASADL